MWVDVATRLAAEDGWEPVYWTGNTGILAAVDEAFPDCIPHDNFAACRGLPASELYDLPHAPVDETVLLDLAPYESIALRMMDRLDPGGAFTHGERVRHYHRLLGYWQAVLEKLRPDVFVTPVSPHLVYDYVLYRLCVRAGVRTVMFHETVVTGLMYSMERFEEGSRELADTTAKLVRWGLPPILSDRSRTFLERARESYEVAMPDYLRELLSDVESQAIAAGGRRTETAQSASAFGDPDPYFDVDFAPPPVEVNRSERFPQQQALRTRLGLGDRRRGTVVEHALDRLLEVCSEQGRRNPQGLADALAMTTYLFETIEREYPYRLRFGDEAPANYLKRAAASPADGALTNLEYWLCRLVAKRAKSEFAAYYAEHVEPLDSDVPYLYFALPYQPEKSTSPEAGVYADLVAAVELLSLSIPDGWRIAVREHPFQWNSRGSGEQCRSLSFYEDFVELPNVQFVSLETSPFELMDGARAVVTMTGTSGFEAVVRGVPVLAFGKAWYLACEGVFPATTRASLTEALDRIAAGYRPDATKVELFVQALETVGFHGYSIPDLAEASGVGEEENVEAFTNAIRERVIGAGGEVPALRVAG
jgi:hypothetical protein